MALRLLREEVALSEWTCLAYAIMSTHYHILLRLEKPTLSSGFMRLNLRYARYYNNRYGLRGHVFERRFGSRIVEGPGDELETARYIALNPARANMCRLPEDYGWSSYGATVGFFPPDSIVDLASALAPVDGSRAAYRRFVEEGDPRLRRGQVRARPQGYGGTRSETTSGWSVPFVETNEPPGKGSAPSNVEHRPPPSSTISRTGA